MADRTPRLETGNAIRDLSKGKWIVYPFFGVHMLMFGLSGFLMAYATESPNVIFMYLHGGIAIAVYMVFYLVIFGADEVKWMAINAALGVFGIYSQIGWMLGLFGKQIDDFPWYVHLTPFVYFVLYTFLLRQFLLDITRSRDHPMRSALVNNAYIVLSLLVYGWTLWRGP